VKIGQYLAKFKYGQKFAAYFFSPPRTTNFVSTAHKVAFYVRRFEV